MGRRYHPMEEYRPKFYSKEDYREFADKCTKLRESIQATDEIASLMIKELALPLHERPVSFGRRLEQLGDGIVWILESYMDHMKSNVPYRDKCNFLPMGEIKDLARKIFLLQSSSRLTQE